MDGYFELCMYIFPQHPIVDWCNLNVAQVASDIPRVPEFLPRQPEFSSMSSQWYVKENSPTESLITMSFFD